MAKQSFAGGFMGLFPEFRPNFSPPHEVAAFMGTHPPDVLAFMGTRPLSDMVAITELLFRGGHPPPSDLVQSPSRSYLKRGLHPHPPGICPEPSSRAPELLFLEGDPHPY